MTFYIYKRWTMVTIPLQSSISLVLVSDLRLGMLAEPQSPFYLAHRYLMTHGPVPPS